MINSLTPDMVAWAMENYHVSLSDRAAQLQVQRHTLRRAMAEATEQGLAAFSSTCLVDCFRDIAEGKTLTEAYTAYTLSGLPYRSRDSFRNVLRRLNINYIKTGANQYV